MSWIDNFIGEKKSKPKKTKSVLNRKRKSTDRIFTIDMPGVAGNKFNWTAFKYR